MQWEVKFSRKRKFQVQPLSRKDFSVDVLSLWLGTDPQINLNPSFLKFLNPVLKDYLHPLFPKPFHSPRTMVLKLSNLKSL